MLEKVKCPVCNNKGEYFQENEEIICQCGYVIITPYPYVAGIKLNTDIGVDLK